MLQEIFTKINGASNQQKGASNQPKLYTILLAWLWKVCFVSVAWTVSVSRAFVYSAVDVNKIATAFLAKLPP